MGAKISMIVALLAMAGSVVAQGQGVSMKVAQMAHVSADVPTPRLGDVRQANVRVVPMSAAPLASSVEMASAGKAVEDYFNGLSSMQAEFSQSVTGEDFASEGTFYWRKPKQFLWQYETPHKQKIVSTGSAVYYVDGEGGQVTQLPMNGGLARIFNAKKLNLAREGLKVVGVRSNDRELVVTLALVKADVVENQAGIKTVKLVFARNPMVIEAIEAVDTLQATTKVTFSKVRAGVRLADGLFAFTPGVYQNRN